MKTRAWQGVFAYPQPKLDISDFGQSKMPNSGKPEFGCGERETGAA